MGSVVFPDAMLKIYLTADPAERARRRYNQLIEKGMGANMTPFCRRSASAMNAIAAVLRPPCKGVPTPSSSTRRH